MLNTSDAAPMRPALSRQGMCDPFQQLCVSDVDRATRFTHLLEDRRPHYQRVLDYILAHPEDRDSIAASLSHSLDGEPGATRASIYLLQFLMEAVLISLFGGVIGLILAVVVSYGLVLATGFPLAPSWITIVVALCVSIATGLISGFYPAYRASSLRPVVALRYE